MKRVTLITLAALTLLVASCASYSCPTYSKAPKAEQQKRI